MNMTQSNSLRGVFVVLSTPFNPQTQEIDASALAAHIDHIIQTGIHGLVPGGSTGEFTALTTPERKCLVELCVKFAGGRVPVVAGVGGLTSRDTLDLAMHAAGAGVTALMVVPPFYDAVSIPQLHELLGQIRDSTGLPLMYYHIPSATGTKLSTEQLAHLSEAGVRYVKYISEDAIGLMEMLYERGDSVVTFGGMDTLMFDAVAAGAQGVVWGLANVVPDLCLQFWDAVAVRETWLAGASSGLSYGACVNSSSLLGMLQRSRQAWSYLEGLRVVCASRSLCCMTYNESSWKSTWSRQEFRSRLRMVTGIVTGDEIQRSNTSKGIS
jgi:dihydrodipicolinate synthase/N-acetylneuraminate lyase